MISGDANRDDFNVSGTDITNLDTSPETRLDDNSSVLNITAAAGDLVTLTGLTFTGGIGSDFGGIANDAADLVINRATVTGNRSTESGGGISNASGTVTIDKSTISENLTTGSNADGGGIHTVDGLISLTLSTVSGNQTLGDGANGAGISSDRGDLLLDSVTLTDNSAAGLGGGVFVANSSSNPSFTLNNTVVAANEAAAGRPDLSFDSGGLVDIQFSLVGDSTGTPLIAAPVGSPDANGNLIGAAGGVINPSPWYSQRQWRPNVHARTAS